MPRADEEIDRTNCYTYLSRDEIFLKMNSPEGYKLRIVSLVGPLCLLRSHSWSVWLPSPTSLFYCECLLFDLVNYWFTSCQISVRTTRKRRATAVRALHIRHQTVNPNQCFCLRHWSAVNFLLWSNHFSTKSRHTHTHTQCFVTDATLA